MNKDKTEQIRGLEDVIRDSYVIIDSQGDGFENVKMWFLKKLEEQKQEIVEEILEKTKILKLEQFTLDTVLSIIKK